MSSLDVLAVCYYAPPQLTPQAIQIGRQLYHLDAKVTLLHGRDAQCAAGYDQYPDFFRRIVPLEVAHPGPLLKGIAHRAAQRLLPLYGTCPDAFGPWRRAAYPVALQAIAHKRPDVLVSFGMPMSGHLMALDIKRQSGLPWLAHFSDPWADNPFHETNWLEHKVNAAMEAKVIAAADQVLFTSTRTLALVMDKYPRSWRDKAAVLPHAWDMQHFDGPDPQPEPRAPGVRHVIRHIGACYGARSPEPLFAALRRIHERQPERLKGVVFEFVGHMTPAFLESGSYRALPPGLVTVRGQVNYRTSLTLARDASALLVIDAPSSTPSVFLPSKLVEYIGARRPVWGITPPGTSADLIAEWGGSARHCAAPGDLEAIARMLVHGLDQLDGDQLRAQQGPLDVLQRYAPAQVAGKLKAHIQSAIERSRSARVGQVPGIA